MSHDDDWYQWPRDAGPTSVAELRAHRVLLEGYEKAALTPGISPELAVHFRREAKVVRTQIAEYLAERPEQA